MSAGRGRDAAAGRPGDGFQIGRTPVLGDHGVPLTYVSRADAEAFCAGNGVRLPTELEWEAAARGGDDRLWFKHGSTSPVGSHPEGASPTVS
jgi:formylglycine-generating enzyme required for sulfatase activity